MITNRLETNRDFVRKFEVVPESFRKNSRMGGMINTSVERRVTDVVFRNTSDEVSSQSQMSIFMEEGFDEFSGNPLFFLRETF